MRTTAERSRSRLADAHGTNGLAFWDAIKRVDGAADAIEHAPLRAIAPPGDPELREKLAARLDGLLEKVARVRNRVAGDPVAAALGGIEADALNLRQMVAEGRLMNSMAFADLRRVSPQAISKALAARRVFYVEIMGRRLFPWFFVHPGLERKQVEVVCKDLGELPGLSKLQFFTTPKASLSGQSPLAALAAGQFSKVRVAAQGFAER